MQSPPCSRIADASAAALDSVPVVRTVKNPSCANFCAIAPPTPQRTPTGSALSSTGLPSARAVMRPSDCHFEVAPTTTATGLPFAFALRFSLIRTSSVHPESNQKIQAPNASDKLPDCQLSPAADDLHVIIRPASPEPAKMK